MNWIITALLADGTNFTSQPLPITEAQECQAELAKAGAAYIEAYRA